MNTERPEGFRTMRQLPTSLELARAGVQPQETLDLARQWKGLFSLSPREEERVRACLELEKARFRRQRAQVETSRKRLFQFRAKLMAVKVRNDRLMELRYRLQRESWSRPK